MNGSRPWREGDDPVVPSVRLVVPGSRGLTSDTQGNALIQNEFDKLNYDRDMRERGLPDRMGARLPPMTPEQYQERQDAIRAQAESRGYSFEADERSDARRLYDEHNGGPERHTAPDGDGWPQSVPVGTRRLIESTKIADNAPLIDTQPGQLDAVDAYLATSADSATAAKLAFLARRNVAVLNLLSGYARAAHRYFGSRPA